MFSLSLALFLSRRLPSTAVGRPRKHAKRTSAVLCHVAVQSTETQYLACKAQKCDTRGRGSIRHLYSSLFSPLLCLFRSPLFLSLAPHQMQTRSRYPHRRRHQAGSKGSRGATSSHKALSTDRRARFISSSQRQHLAGLPAAGIRVAWSPSTLTNERKNADPIPSSTG